METGGNIIELESVDSTNLYLSNLTGCQDVEEGTVVRASYQSHGKGHEGAQWESRAGMNLLFSILLRPDFLPVESQFYISKVISLALRDFVAGCCDEVRIKWPNDLYAGGRKIAGILIENTVENTGIRHSIVGIGLNVNQDSFSPEIPNPTSLRIETGREFDLQEVLTGLLRSIEKRYAQLESGGIDRIDSEYLGCLYRYLEESEFIADGGRFIATITGVLGSGELVLMVREGQTRTFSFKEVSFS